MYMPKQNKAMLIETETEKDIPAQVDKPVTGRVGSLSLGEEVVQAQGPFLYGQVGVERLHT